MADNKFIFIIGVLFLTISLASANKPLNCLSCEGINCLRTSINKTQQCIDPLDVCITVFDKFAVVRKGCSMEIPVELRKKCEKRDSIECHKCNQDKCNNLGREDFRCISCDSSNNANCKTNPSSLAPVRCGSPAALNSYCYVRYENNVTKRGCALTVKEQNDCFKSSSCMLCLPGDQSGCNKIDFTPNSLRAFLV